MPKQNNVCINCIHIRRNEMQHYYCERTSLPTEETGSCELFHGRELLQERKKRNKYLLPVLITVIALLLPFFRYARRENKKIEFQKSIVTLNEQQRREIYFEEYTLVSDKDDKKRIRGLFYTLDSSCSEARFENEIEDYFYKLPDTLANYDTIYLDHILVKPNSDSSLTILHYMEAYSIKFYKGRRYERIDKGLSKSVGE